MCVECGQKIKMGIEVCTGSSNMEVIDILEESSFHGNIESSHFITGLMVNNR